MRSKDLQSGTSISENYTHKNFIILKIYGVIYFHLVSQTKDLLPLILFFAMPLLVSDFNISTKFELIKGFDSYIASNLCNDTELNVF